MGLNGCFEMLVRNYHYTLRNIPEERRSRLGTIFAQGIYGVIYFRSKIDILSLNACS